MGWSHGSCGHESWQAIDSLGFSKLLVTGNPIRSDGKFAALCDQGDRDGLEQRPPHLACRHFNVPSTASPHADLDRSPWGMAHKYRVPVEGIVFDGSGNTGRDIMKALERRYLFGLIPYFGSKPGGRFYVNARTACAAALARRLDPQTDRGVTRKPFHIPIGPHVQALFKELNELRYRLKAEKSELETKQDMMMRLGRSPDFADAICMTFRAEATFGT